MENRISTTEFAERTGYARSTICKWAREGTPVDLDAELNESGQWRIAASEVKRVRRMGETEQITHPYWHGQQDNPLLEYIEPTSVDTKGMRKLHALLEQEIGKRIRKSDLGEALGKHPSQISRYFNPEQLNPPIDFVVALRLLIDKIRTERERNKQKVKP